MDLHNVAREHEHEHGHEPSSVSNSASSSDSLYAPLTVNIDALRKGCETLLGTPVKDVTFLDQGSMHKVYLITFHERKEIVARVARNLCPRRKMESEAATIKYLRSKTSIPIPKVLHVSTDEDGAVGGEYMLQEKVDGVKLSKVLDSLSTEQKASLARQLTMMHHELYQQRFDKMGSLYEDGAGNFYIGPIVELNSIAGRRSFLNIDCGPFETVTDYLLACINRERIAYSAHCPMDAYWKRQEYYILDSLDNMEDIVRARETSDATLPPFALRAGDMAPNNIFVDSLEPSRIIGIIDWEFTYTCPLFEAALRPPWMVPNAEPLPEQYPGERAKLTPLAETMLAEAAALDGTYHGLMQREGHEGLLEKEEVIIGLVSMVDWTRMTLIVDNLEGFGFSEGWPTF